MEPMTLLLDTHTLLWWLFNSQELSGRARVLLADPSRRILVSSASAWEIATKFRLGKLPHAEPLVRDFGGWLERARLEELAISAAHSIRAGTLAGAHRDPFDRMLAAQALAECVPVLGCDEAITALGASQVW